MSSLEVPPFDILTGGVRPFEGFGQTLPDTAERLHRLLLAAEDARVRVEMGFRRRLDDREAVPAEIDLIIDKMWNQGWSPEKGNVNLFANDFGLVVVSTLHSLAGSRLVFRSEDDVSHLSTWWADQQIEAFPFHHVLKCLCRRGEGSVGYFVRSISARVAGAGRQ